RKRVSPEILLRRRAALGAEVILHDLHDRRQIVRGKLVGPVAAEDHLVFAEDLEQIVEGRFVESLIRGGFTVDHAKYLGQFDKYLLALRQVSKSYFHGGFGARVQPGKH